MSRMLILSCLLLLLCGAAGCNHTTESIGMSQVTMSLADAYIPARVGGAEILDETGRELSARGYQVVRSPSSIVGRGPEGTISARVQGRPGESRHYTVEAVDGSSQGRISTALEVGNAVLVKLELR